MTFYEPLSDEFGAIVCGDPNNSLLSLDRAELLARFRSRGVLLFRGFPVGEGVFREFTEAYGYDFVVRASQSVAARLHR